MKEKLPLGVVAAVLAVVVIAVVFLGWHHSQSLNGGADVSKEYADFYSKKAKSAPQNSPEAASPFYQSKRDGMAGH